MKVLILDNYDSFTYNLLHYCEPHVAQVDVIRNDRFNAGILKNYQKIIFSPGPGLPDESPTMYQILNKYDGPILGVCLGLQAIVCHFGGRLKNLASVLHGVSSKASIAKADPLYKDVPQVHQIGHYHSWVADPEYFPSELEVLSRCELGNIMSLRHINKPIHAVQFHPESVMTPEGKKIIENWLRI